MIKRPQCKGAGNSNSCLWVLVLFLRALQALIVTILAASQTFATSSIEYYFLNIGQGLSVYIDCRSPQGRAKILYDLGGEDSNYIYPTLSTKNPKELPYSAAKAFIRKQGKLDRIYLSHPHTDHYSGLDRTTIDSIVSNKTHVYYPAAANPYLTLSSKSGKQVSIPLFGDHKITRIKASWQQKLQLLSAKQAQLHPVAYMQQGDTLPGHTASMKGCEHSQFNIIYAAAFPDFSLKKLKASFEKAIKHFSTKEKSEFTYAFNDYINTAGMRKLFSNPNDWSLALNIETQIDNKNFSALLTGDIEEKSEPQLINNISSDNIDLYTASHHGSRTSTSKSLLDKINPKTVIISPGLTTAYHHPSCTVVNRIIDNMASNDQSLAAPNIRNVITCADDNNVWQYIETRYRIFSNRPYVDSRLFNRVEDSENLYNGFFGPGMTYYIRVDSAIKELQPRCLYPNSGKIKSGAGAKQAINQIGSVASRQHHSVKAPRAGTSSQQDTAMPDVDADEIMQGADENDNMPTSQNFTHRTMTTAKKRKRDDTDNSTPDAPYNKKPRTTSSGDEIRIATCELIAPYNVLMTPFSGPSHPKASDKTIIPLP